MAGLATTESKSGIDFEDPVSSLITCIGKPSQNAESPKLKGTKMIGKTVKSIAGST
jgi:hypothetical protein